MRKLALAAIVLSAATGGLFGCGGSTSRKLTGTGGTSGAGGEVTGTAGTGGIATGTGGTDAGATAGTTGTAGMDAAAGAGGMDAAAGTVGTAGTGGMDAAVVETAPPPPPYCGGTVPTTPLPYNVSSGFTTVHPLNATTTWQSFVNPVNCDTDMNFPSLAPPDGGVDGATEAGTEAGTDGGVDDAGEAGASDGGGAEVATEAGSSEAGTEAGSEAGVTEGGGDGTTSDGATSDGAVADGGDASAATPPACYKFTYYPDSCTPDGSNLASCWSGIILEPSDQGQAGAGVCIASGAMHVTFMARASKAGAIVKFGSTREGEEAYLTMTTSWAPYSVAITDDYLNDTRDIGMPGGVWNGFSAVMEPAPNLGGVYLFVKDIQWVTQ